MAKGARHAYKEPTIKITPQTKLILEEIHKNPLQCVADVSRAIDKNFTWCYNRCMALLEHGYLVDAYSVVGPRGCLRLYRVNQEKCKHILQ